jgi:hypothetical protein
MAAMKHMHRLRETARTWYFAAAEAAVAIAQKFSVRKNRTHLEERIERLADEIIAVAESIEADLAQLPAGSDLSHLARQCTRSRKLADQSSRQRVASVGDMEEVANQLHDDHWRVVNLRSDMDALIVRRRDGDTNPRSCKFATGSKPARSRWSSTLSHTSSHAGSHTTRSSLE